MGVQVSVKNDTGDLFTMEIRDSKDKVVKGWKLEIKSGEEATIREHLRPGSLYTLKMCLGSDSSKNEVEQKFYSFAPRENLSFKVSVLLIKAKLKELELEYLLDEILPGIRIQDRVYLGKTYPRCFVANELVAYMVLHRIAESPEEAVEKCRVLQDCNIIEHVVHMNNQFKMKPFENKYLFYRFRESHKLIEKKIAHLDVDDLMTPRRTSLRYKAFATSKLLSIRGLEGWLEKRSKLGMWQKRFFRVLTQNESKLGNHIAYFDSIASLTPKGIIPADEIDMVTLYEKSKHNRSFRIAMTEDGAGKQSYILRAPTQEICSKWLGALKPFAKRLSPIDVVSRSALVFVFTNDMLRTFARLLKRQVIKKGEWICKRGEVAQDFFFLKDGKIGVYMPVRRKTTHVLFCTQIPISFFGESVFTSTNNRRPLRRASCKAEEDCELLVLTAKDREAFMKQYSEVKGPLYVLLHSGIEKRIEQVPFLRSLRTNDFAKLKLGLHYQALHENEVLFYEGDPGKEFYIVYAGELKIVQYDAKNDKEIVLRTVGRADCFGEISLMLPDVPRTATVIATEPTLLLSLHEETFKSFLDIAGLDLSVVMRERIVNTFKHYHIPFFDAIPEESSPRLAHSCKLEIFDKNEVIFKAGDDGDKFYIVSYGEVAVTVDEKEIALLKSGSYFGEIALVVEDTPRTATCIAKKKTVLLSMSKKSFRSFFADRPEALADVELKIAGKKCQIRSIMYHPKGIEQFTSFLKKQYAEESIEFWHEVQDIKDNVILILYLGTSISKVGYANGSGY